MKLVDIFKAAPSGRCLHLGARYVVEQAMAVSGETAKLDYIILRFETEFNFIIKLDSAANIQHWLPCLSGPGCSASPDRSPDRDSYWPV